MLLLAAAAVLTLGVGDISAKDNGDKNSIKPEKGNAVKEEFKNHFKFYGFIRNFFAFDTRESVAGTGDLFYYLPKDRALNAVGDDMNARNQFRYLALTTRLGVDVYGYQVGRTMFGAKVETDFYSGISGVTGTATLRLRQAYATIGWKDLPMCGDAKAAVTLKVGQAWHPIAADQPSTISLATGTPFNPFSRTPQVTMDAALGGHFVITGSAIWQMQYTSAGPNGAKADYIKYSCTPELFAGVTFKTKSGFSVKLGVDVLSIKPRVTGTALVDVNPDSQLQEIKSTTVKVSDRITTASPFLYLQYSHKSLLVKAKTVYGSAGEHVNLMSGYGITGKFAGQDQDGHYEYAPLHSSSSWLSISYGKKLQGMLMLGYVKNLGSSTPFAAYKAESEQFKDYTAVSDIYFSKNGFHNLNSLYRIAPALVYNVGKFTLGLEYELTGAQYGEYAVDSVMENGAEKKIELVSRNGLAIDNLHWITNHRVQLMFRFNF